MKNKKQQVEICFVKLDLSCPQKRRPAIRGLLPNIVSQTAQLTLILVTHVYFGMERKWACSFSINSRADI